MSHVHPSLWCNLNGLILVLIIGKDSSNNWIRLVEYLCIFWMYKMSRFSRAIKIFYWFFTVKLTHRNLWILNILILIFKDISGTSSQNLQSPLLSLLSMFPIVFIILLATSISEGYAREGSWGDWGPWSQCGLNSTLSFTTHRSRFDKYEQKN